MTTRSGPAEPNTRPEGRSPTGRDYFDVVREVIYEPAGMADTDYYELDRPVPNLAVGYSRDYGGEDARWTNNLLETGYIVAVLSNYDRGSSLVNAKIRELLSRIPRR